MSAVCPEGGSTFSLPGGPKRKCQPCLIRDFMGPTRRPPGRAAHLMLAATPPPPSDSRQPPCPPAAHLNRQRRCFITHGLIHIVSVVGREPKTSWHRIPDLSIKESSLDPRPSATLYGVMGKGSTHAPDSLSVS